MQQRNQNRLSTAAVWLLAQAALLAAATLLAGPAGLLGVCLAAWPLAAWINEKQGWAGYALPLMTGGSALVLLGGTAGAPLAAWCLGGLVALILARRPVPMLAEKPRWFRQGAVYGSMAVLSLVAVILLLQRSYPGGIAPGMAEEIITVIGSAPNSAQLLYGFHQMGLVPLESSMTLVTEGADGLLYMTEEVRKQLLYGLHARLEEAMALAIPSWSIYLVTLTTLLCVMLPVTARRRRGEKDDTPRFEKWHLPREIGLPLGCMFAGALLPIVTGSPALAAMGQMMTAVASVVFSLLGAAVLRFASKLAGRHPMMTWMMILLAALALPQLLMLLGVLDQVMDMRKLRKNNETEEDRE